tara:strand:+ start:308 stop:613 length:306 start_codon:yes stop_codon:yes gene_type:complete
MTEHHRCNECYEPITGDIVQGFPAHMRFCSTTCHEAHKADEAWREERDASRFVICCAKKLATFNFTNTCTKCGTDYNWAGQMLAPRACWGEETGEHPSDCI